MNRKSDLEAGSLMHGTDTAVGRPAAIRKNLRSLGAVNSKRKVQRALGTGTGATGLTPNIQDLLEPEKPALVTWSLWQNLHAIVVEEALHHRRKLFLTLLLCTAAGSLLLVSLTYIIFGRDNPSTLEVCGNKDCVDHVATLSLANNEDIASPCKNFAQFVCSGVKNKYSFLADSVVMQRILQYPDEIIRLDVNHSIFRRPTEMFRRCVEANSRDDGTLKAFVEFLRHKSFAWPTPDETDAFPDANSRNYSQPLKIMLDLAVTWAVPTWFRYDLLFRREDSDRAIRLAPSPMGRVGKLFHEVVVSAGFYDTYVEFIASIIFSLRKPTPAFASFVWHSKTMQEDIYNNLSIMHTNYIFHPKKVPLREMPSFLRQLAVEEWQRALRTVYNVHPPISSDDVVVVTNYRLLVVMRTLFHAYTPQEIAFHIVWWYAQIACSLSSSALFNAISSLRLGSQVHSSYCSAVAKSFYNILLAAASKADTPIQDQIRINTCFENLKTLAVAKVESMTKMEDLTKHAIHTMFMLTESVVWPNGTLASPDGLQRHYGRAYNGSGGLVDELVAIARFHQRFIGTHEGNLAAKIFFPTGARMSFYDPVHNVISVATDPLGPPFYYSTGTSAMTYGGLGFIYAMEVVVALNSISALVAENLTSASNQPSNGSLSIPSTCENHDLLFPELPALALAHAAYLRFRDADSDFPLNGLSYSPEQIFFISFCHSTCLFYPNNTHFSPVCNEVVKNFAPFSRAFSCPLGSEMNPAMKCQYF